MKQQYGHRKTWGFYHRVSKPISTIFAKPGYFKKIQVQKNPPILLWNLLHICIFPFSVEGSLGVFFPFFLVGTGKWVVPFPHFLKLKVRGVHSTLRMKNCSAIALNPLYSVCRATVRGEQACDSKTLRPTAANWKHKCNTKAWHKWTNFSATGVHGCGDISPLFEH